MGLSASRIQVLRVSVWGRRFQVLVWALKFRAWGLQSRIYGLGLLGLGLRFTAFGSNYGSRFWALGFEVWGFAIWDLARFQVWVCRLWFGFGKWRGSPRNPNLETRTGALS